MRQTISTPDVLPFIYDDIVSECCQAGFAKHSILYYLKVYNNAIRMVCDYIIRVLETSMYCYQGIDAY